MTKKSFKNINGILLLDKPLHMTSNQALQCVKHLFSAKKAGHTGSLDPLATGMLPICFGEATKFSQFLLESDKSYEVTAHLGIKTTTGDAEGKIIETKPIKSISYQQIEEVLQNFVGIIEQIPPMYSAIKHQGKPLYELARKGIEIERNARKIHVYQLQLQDFQSDKIFLKIHCSKGTYVRTLIEDIGEKLGCGAYVSHLRRPNVFPYQEMSMCTLQDLRKAHEQEGEEVLTRYLLPPETSVESYPSVKLTASAVFYIRMGQPITMTKLPQQGLVRIFSETNRFIGIGEVLEKGRLTPKRLIK